MLLILWIIWMVWVITDGIGIKNNNDKSLEENYDKNNDIDD